MPRLNRRDLLIGLGTLGVAGAAKAAPPAAIRVTYVSAPFNVPSIVARRRGMLEAEFARDNIKVEQPEITSGAQQVQAIAAGAVDIASVLGGTSAILGRANGVPLTVVAVYSRSPKAFNIMTMANGPATIEALRGKRVAGPVGTTLNQLLVAALVSRRMKLDDVRYINMDLPSARAALLAGSVDAATLAGNHVFAVEAAGGRAIADGQGLIEPTTVIGARDAFLAQHPQLARRYLGVHRAALDFMAREPDKALEIAAAEQRISMDEARRMLPWYDFSPRLTERDIANLEADQRFMLDNRMIPRTIDLRRDLIGKLAGEAR